LTVQQDLHSDLVSEPENAPRSPLSPPALAGLLAFLVVLAVLIAAPAVNLPSLLGVAKLASPKVSLATGLLVLSCASVAGLAVGV
jgi:hypothetical protein